MGIDQNWYPSKKIGYSPGMLDIGFSKTWVGYSLPILDTLQKMTNSLLVNVDIPINTKRLKD